MKESMWGYLIISLGLLIITIILFVQRLTTTNEEDFYLGREVLEAAMIDAVDYGSYRTTGDLWMSKEKFVEKTAITLSCKMAIKANDHISIEEAEELLNTLRKCSNPFTCPHGRPTIITYSKYELERLFKRSMN